MTAAPPRRRTGALFPLARALALAGALAGAPSAGGARAQSADDEIRPYDKVILTVSPNAPIIGTIEGDWDAQTSLELVIRTTRGATMRIASEQIQDVVRRQTADDVYAKKARAAQAERDPARRAAAELALAIWSRSPLSALDGKAPRPSSALAHTLNAVRLSPELCQAYPHLISLLEERGSLEDSDEERVGLEVEAALLAERGGCRDPELDYRLGIVLATSLRLPARARPLLERYLASAHPNLGQRRKARATLRDIYVEAGETEKAIAMYEALVGGSGPGPGPGTGTGTGPGMAPAAGIGAEIGSFEPLFELARLYARGLLPADRARARDLFVRAQAVQPDLVEIEQELAALDFRDGSLDAAEKRLKALVGGKGADPSPSIDLATVLIRRGRLTEAKALLDGLGASAAGIPAYHVARGWLLESGGDVPGACGEYRQAVAADPGDLGASILLGHALVRAGRPDEAKSLAEGVIAGHPGNPWTFAAASRLRAEVEIRDGRQDAALEDLARSVEIEPGDVFLLERTGILSMRLGRTVAGSELLRRVREIDASRPATLNATAYHHYVRGELTDAARLFEEVLRLVPASKAAGEKAPPPPPPERIYALGGRDLIRDFERLEVWAAEFQGPDAPTLGGWREVERYGIEIARKGSLVVVAGKQSGDPDGVTSAMLERPTDAGTFDRVTLRGRIDSGRVRLGLRLEGRSARGAASAGLVLYRDLDGTLRIQIKSTRGDWEPVQPTTETSPERGRLVYSGTARWPEDGGFHTLEIRRTRGREESASAQRATGFDLLLDGEPIAWNVKVGGLGNVQYEVGFSGQTDALGSEYSMSLESFKIYRERPRPKGPSRER